MERMNVSGLTIDPFTNMPIIILKNDDKSIALPIWIGLIEASSIATELEEIELSRPMTHDVMTTILIELKAQVSFVEITELTDNTFFSNIVLEKSDGTEFKIDCRPSDAIALALRTNAEIFVAQDVIQKSRKIESEQQTDDQLKSQKWAEILENLTPEDFGKYKM